MLSNVEQSPDARPVAYIRRSVVSRSAPGDTSREVQTQAVREIAGEDGDRLRIFDGDWGRSASRHELEGRTAFAEMVAAIREGAVSFVYAYAEDRLARDVEAAAHLLNVCERAGVPIVTKNATYPPGDRMARSAFHLAAMMNEDYSSQASGKQADVVASRRRRGDALGPPPYGMRIASHAKGEVVTWEPDPEQDPAVVLAAYREAGSFHGAARLLNDRGVPGPACPCAPDCKREHRHRTGRWYSGSVGRILHENTATRDAFEVRHTERRVKHGGSAAIFRRLLVCQCRGLLTPTRQRDGSFVYRCNAGYVEPILSIGPGRRSVRPGHPNGITISEKVVRAWAEEESARWDQVVIELKRADGPAVDPAELAEERRRAGLAFTKGALTEPQLDAELKRIDAQLARVADRAEARRFLRNRLGVDWSAEPQDIAVACRRLWSAIHLGPDMRPVRADWRVRPPVTDEELSA